MKSIVLFGAGRSATCLIDYLIANAPKNKWHLYVIDYDLALVKSRIGKSYYATADAFDVKIAEDVRKEYIQKADIVISLLPPQLHTIIAKDCIKFKKSLLTASYLDNDVKKMQQDIKKADVLFLYEMGVDPGIDHMSAMRIIDSIEKKGGTIHSFRSFCGGLISPENDDNPWHYKVSWNPRNIVTAGMDGAVFKEKGKIKNVSYDELFEHYCNKTIVVPGVGKLAYYPNRNSLNYMEAYHLRNAHTFMRATLRFPEFCEGWRALVKMNLTDKHKKFNTNQQTYQKWVTENIKPDKKKPLEKNIADYLGIRENSKVMRQLKYLGFLNGELINKGEKTNAEILQLALENKLKMNPADKDIIVMAHEIEFERRSLVTKLMSYLVVEGEDSIRTAMAKTVGLPLAIMTKLILTDKINLTGLHIPVDPEIYIPVLKELEEHGIFFEESFD